MVRPAQHAAATSLGGGLGLEEEHPDGRNITPSVSHSEIRGAIGHPISRPITLRKEPTGQHHHMAS